MSVETIEVTQDEADIRLDRWLRRHVPALTQASIQRWCRTGQVRVDGARADANSRLAPGQQVRVPPLPAALPAAGPKPHEQVDPAVRAELQDWILYQDQAVIVLNKPPGLAVQGGPGISRHLDGMLDALRDPAIADGARPRLVHRLDRDTSGVLILARSPGTAAKLAAGFRGRDVRKTYWAVVAGRPVPLAGRINLPLIRSAGPRGERTVAAEHGDKEADRAITDYETLDNAGQKLAWLQLHPITGRTHQLRVHCVAIQAPIVGDLKYHQPDQNNAFSALVEGLSNKLHLHARALDVPHPDGGRLVVEAPLPKHMQTTFRTLGFTARPPAPTRAGLTRCAEASGSC